MTAAHPIVRRWYAEELIRLRRADERRRYLASQRAGRIDPNPHQIEAVIFALSRIGQGGCILADEVGLGKTIEAGLVMAQLRAEGRSRMLLITPKPLVGQWRQELETLFGIETTEGKKPSDFEGPGVFLVGREFAGSERGAEALSAHGAFDLCVIDEAHEIFSGIYRRYDRKGRLRTEARYARTAARVKALLADTPALLLTATPIQNSLAELWGLVQYVEPTGTLLGDLSTFRTVFCDGDDRKLRAGQGEELRQRIAAVCQRTLRRQAQEFMHGRFVQRRARLFEYEMSDDERALYDDVTEYLCEPQLCAFRGGHRRLLLLSFHRRMASSIRALEASLEAVVQRLARRMGADDATVDMFVRDLEDDDEPAPPDRDEGPAPRGDAVAQELRRVAGLLERARSLKVDAKAHALLQAVGFVLAAPQSSGRVVIFTEALSTQDYLAELLAESGLAAPDEVTLFRGDNKGPRAAEALRQWEREVGALMPKRSRPSRSVAIRLALVHEFQTRSKVFIATEAGAKGLNLQFCDTVINYDLPWNPQRIEQRIGRCHRYGQTRDVTVINFLARDNAAQRLTFEILSRKLELFGTVLDASDAILFDPGARGRNVALAGALSVDFEAQLRAVYEQARGRDEIESGLRALGAAMDDARAQFEQTHERTAGIIETRFDETVRSAFREIADDLPQGLAAFDHDLGGVVARYLTAVGAAFERQEQQGRVVFDIEPCEALPDGLREGARVVAGSSEGLAAADSLHLGHPLIRAAVQEARRATRRPMSVVVPRAALPEQWQGRRGLVTVVKMHAEGFEPVAHLVAVAVVDGQLGALDLGLAQHLILAVQVDGGEMVGPIGDDSLADAVDEALFGLQADVDAREDVRFEAAIERIERFVEDRILAQGRDRAQLQERLRDAQARRDAAAGADARTRAEQECRALASDLEAIEKEVARLRARDDEQYEVWRVQAHQRRYAPPRRETIFEAEFVVA